MKIFAEPKCSVCQQPYRVASLAIDSGLCKTCAPKSWSLASWRKVKINDDIAYAAIRDSLVVLISFYLFSNSILDAGIIGSCVFIVASAWAIGAASIMMRRCGALAYDDLAFLRMGWLAMVPVLLLVGFLMVWAGG